MVVPEKPGMTVLTLEMHSLDGAVSTWPSLCCVTQSLALLVKATIA